MRKIGATRRQLVESIDAPALAALPAEPYEYAEWKKARVAPDYHIELHGHFYSVPSSLIRQTVEARITEATVEVFHNGKRVAAHVRSRVRNRHTTVREHMPSAHRRYAERTPQRITREAAAVGPATAQRIETILRAKPHPEQGFRAALGILRLARSYGSGRLEAACLRRPQHRRQHLRPDCLDPEERPRQGLPRRCRADQRPDPPRQHPRPRYYH